MLYKEYITIKNLSVHRIGNKQTMEGVKLSMHPVKLDDTLREILKTYFLMAFKDNERYRFDHPTTIGLNTVFNYVSEMFKDYSTFHKQSMNMAKYLYEQSEHPNIKCGDFYVVYFKDCILDGETLDAIGLFKSENKDTYIRINQISEDFNIEYQSGMNINKLDKGCLIFNIKKDEGYIVCVVDNSNRNDAKYWINDFLKLKRRDDDFLRTEQAVSLCKSFISHLPNDYDKASKAFMINKVIDTLGEESISMRDIAERVFKTIGAGDAFMSYLSEHLVNKEINIDDSFQGKKESINRHAVRSINKVYLDNNFEIRVFGGENNISRGYDQKRGQNYYILYFDKEK